MKEVVAAAPAATLPIEVVSARPEWLELMAPCSLAVAERVQGFVMQLETGLDQDVRESVAAAFRELLFNAVEWGGKLDPTRKVRISCLRTKRMLLYRIADPGEGFNIEALCHAAVCNPEDDPLRHAIVREEQGLRPGGLGIAITRIPRRRTRLQRGAQRSRVREVSRLRDHFSHTDAFFAQLVSE